MTRSSKLESLIICSIVFLSVPPPTMCNFICDVGFESTAFLKDSINLSRPFFLYKVPTKIKSFFCSGINSIGYIGVVFLQQISSYVVFPFLPKIASRNPYIQ